WPRGVQESLELLAEHLGEGVRAHGLLEHACPGRDPLVDELLPLPHQLGRGRALTHEFGPGRHPLVHEGLPEGGGVEGMRPAGAPSPRRARAAGAPVPHLAPPGARRAPPPPPPPRHSLPWARHARAASHEDTLGQQCTDAPRPAMSEICPPGNSTYSRSVLA